MQIPKELLRWPLLLVGLAVIAWGVSLADGDRSDARALLLGVGAMLLGAGIARVLRSDDDHHQADDDEQPPDTP